MLVYGDCAIIPALSRSREREIFLCVVREPRPSAWYEAAAVGAKSGSTPHFVRYNLRSLNVSNIPPPAT
jgi:hypothetical protein